MLDRYMEVLDEHLSGHGVITNLILRTEQSLFENEETKEIELYFALTDDDPSMPYAAIHLFPVGEEGSCEIEVEISYTDMERRTNGSIGLWEEAKKVVEEISFTEKRRYLSPERLSEFSVVLDYHFIVSLPQTSEEETIFHQTWERFAQDLTKLVSL